MMKLFARHKGSKWRYCEIVRVDPEDAPRLRAGRMPGIPMFYVEIDGKEEFFPRPAISVEIERVTDA